MQPVTLKTDRLILRPWRDDDLDAFAAISADPVVMEFLSPLAGRADSDAMATRLRDYVETYGFGFWALELPGIASFIGFTGLVHVDFEASFKPAVEIGWRLARAYWGNGYATEAARAALSFGFDTLKLAEIIAFTVPANRRSQAVMERLNMARNPADDFDHPRVPNESPLKRHVLYRLKRSAFRP